MSRCRICGLYKQHWTDTYDARRHCRCGRGGPDVLATPEEKAAARSVKDEMYSYMDRVNWTTVRGFVHPQQNKEFKELWAAYRDTRTDEALEALEEWIANVNKASKVKA